MPIWLRKFTFNKIKDYFDKRNEEQERANQVMSNKNKQLPKGPDIKPTYTTKTSAN